MSGRQQRHKEYIASVKSELLIKGEWKGSATAASFLNGIILCDFVLNGHEGNPPFVQPMTEREAPPAMHTPPDEL